MLTSDLRPLTSGLINFFLLAGCAAVERPIEQPLRVLVETEVYLVPSAGHMPTRCADDNALGCAWTDGDHFAVYLLGYRDERMRVYLRQEVMGHEIQHILHWHDALIANPDGG